MKTIRSVSLDTSVVEEIEEKAHKEGKNFSEALNEIVVRSKKTYDHLTEDEMSNVIAAHEQEIKVLKGVITLNKIEQEAELNRKAERDKVIETDLIKQKAREKQATDDRLAYLKWYSELTDEQRVKIKSEIDSLNTNPADAYRAYFLKTRATQPVSPIAEGGD